MRKSKVATSGFSLIELLISLGIISVLASLLLPAIQSAREAARKAQCANNLRQIGLAILNYESTYRQIPYAKTHNGMREVGWAYGILPYVEQHALFHEIRSPNFQDKTISLFSCPTAPESGNTQVATSSYHPPLGVSQPLIEYIASNPNSGILASTKIKGVFTQSSRKVSDISDGLSNTWLVVEADGAPNYWHKRHIDTGVVEGASSLDPDSAFVICGVDYETGNSPGSIWGGLTNGNRMYLDLKKEIYSFHQNQFVTLRVDGSVHYVSYDTYTPIVFGLVGIDDAIKVSQ